MHFVKKKRQNKIKSQIFQRKRTTEKSDLYLKFWYSAGCFSSLFRCKIALLDFSSSFYFNLHYVFFTSFADLFQHFTLWIACANFTTISNLVSSGKLGNICVKKKIQVVI